MVEELMEALERPTRPLPRKYVEMIIFLAQRMAVQDRIIPVPEPPRVNGFSPSW